MGHCMVNMESVLTRSTSLTGAKSNFFHCIYIVKITNKEAPVIFSRTELH